MCISYIKQQIRITELNLMTTKPDPRIQNLATFLGFTTIDNIESFFNRKYQKWLFDNSHVREITENELENPYPKYDSEGYITNAEFSSTTKDNIPLTQKDFIDKELLILKNLETSSLPLEKKKRIEYYKNFLISKLSDTTSQQKNKEAYKNELWFKVGLKFATGEIKEDALYYKSAPEIAKSLNLPKGSEKHILGTINNYQNPHSKVKNIYAYRNRMQNIIDHCQENNISIDPNFMNRIPTE